MTLRACDPPQPAAVSFTHSQVIPISAARRRTRPTAADLGSQPELHTLITASAAGDEVAFAELYDRTCTRVYATVLHVLRAPDHACEVNQETYLDVWRRAGTYDPTRGTVLSWMTVIAHHRAVDRVRTVARATDLDARVATLAYAAEFDQVWDSVVVNLDAARVRRALAGLTPLQREALMLMYFGRRSPREIADHLRLPLGTVKTRIRDGLIRLRNGMQPA